jgi:hypothetical protein
MILARRGAARSSFILAITASLALTPIVWLHYFALLVALIALTHLEFTWAWLLPLAYWIVPYQETHAETWRIAVGLGLALIVWAVTFHRARLEHGPAAVGHGP